MSDYLPEDIIDKILQRLPLKDLIKCTNVSKSWRSLIKSPDFSHAHLRRTLQTNDRSNGEHKFLLHQKDAITKHEFYTLHWENAEFGKYCKLVNPFHSFRSSSPNDLYFRVRKRKVFEEEYVTNRVGDVLGTCNGLVCLLVNNFLCMIFNPSIRKLVILPEIFPEIAMFRQISVREFARRRGRGLFRQTTRFCGFGYDVGSNDHKVLGLVWGVSRGIEVYIYSLARGSWKSVDGGCGMPPYFTNAVDGEKHVSVNGALHWVLERRKKIEYNVKYVKDNVIVRFDLRSESFGELTVPERLRSEECYVSKYRECLALIRCKLIAVDPYFSEIFMWVMNDYGVAESWTLLYSVQMQGCAYKPISLPFNGEVVVKMYDDDVPLWVDIEKNSIGEFGIKGYKYCSLQSFVESIVLLSHENAVSY